MSAPAIISAPADVPKLDKREAKKAVSAFIAGESQLDRENEINRIMAAFKLNPFEILNVRTDSTSQEVKKQYRELSRLIHPDKCRKEIREVAQKAFNKLTQAKTDVLDEKKREDLNKIVYDARTRLVERMQNDIKKRRKEEAHFAKQRGEKPKDPGSLPDVTRAPNFDDLVKAETKEVLIEQAWKNRQMTRQAEEEDKKIAKEKEEIKKKRDDEEEEKKKWDETRENRVSDWRNFMKGNTRGGKKSKKRLLNMPKLYKTDDDKSYIKRVKSTPSNEKEKEKK